MEHSSEGIPTARSTFEGSLPDGLSTTLIAALERFDETDIDSQDPERIGDEITILVDRGAVWRETTMW
jgi:hypothetical protein